MRLGAVVLAGGQAERFGGRAKELLPLEGTPFLARVVRELAGLGEVLVAVDRPGRHALPGVREVVDAAPGRGPLAGLVAALRATEAEALVAVAADMPLFRGGLAGYLAAFLDDGCDAVAALDRTGRTHPLCAIYRTTCLPVFARRLEAEETRLHDALAAVQTRRAPLAHSAYPDETVTNINTPAAYAALRRRVEGPPVVAVSGVKGSGKTTLLRGVIPLLTAAGLRVGAIKHDGHHFQPDVPGTDSFHLRAAGAAPVAIFSAGQYLIHGPWDNGGLAALLPRFGDVDLVLVEGMKRAPLPRLEVVGREPKARPVCDPATLLGVIGDADPELPGAAFVPRDDLRGAAAVILRYMKGERYA